MAVSPSCKCEMPQPSGGYPAIGTVIEADLWRFGQAPISSRIRFVEAT